jgi:nucleoid DNA-binding protein
VEDIVHKVAEELNLPLAAVRHAVDMQFRMVKKVIESGEMKSIRLRHIGIFVVKKKRLEALVDKFNTDALTVTNERLFKVLREYNALRTQSNNGNKGP